MVVQVVVYGDEVVDVGGLGLVGEMFVVADVVVWHSVAYWRCSDNHLCCQMMCCKYAVQYCGVEQLWLLLLLLSLSLVHL